MKKTTLTKNINMGIPTYLLIATTILSGLIAGLLYAFVCAIKPGLGAMPNQEYLSAMQSINKTIENSLFFISFMGTLALLPICAYISFKNSGVSWKFIIIIWSAAIYFFGVFGVTMFGNMPLNGFLEKIDLAKTTVEELQSIRVKFENPWNSLHQMRTWASFISFSLLVISLSIHPEVS